MPETLTTEPRTLEADTPTPASQPLTVRRPDLITPAAERAAAAPAPIPQDVAYQGPTAIIRALADSQREFTPVAKTKTATVTPRDGGRSYTYQYADLADVFNMALPILARHGLALIQPIRRASGGLMLVTEIWHESGQVLRDDGLPLMVTQSPQAFGSALTYMRRYGACSLLGIAPDADEDAQMAEQDRKEAAELERARARNERADAAREANEKRAKERAEKDANPGEPVITADQVKEWNQARKKAGWSVPEATAYIQDTYKVPLTKLPVRHYEQAMAWARTKPAGEPQTAQAEAPAKQGSVPTLNNEQQRNLWDTARKHGKTGSDVERFLKQRMGIGSTAEIPVARYAEIIEWATKPEDSRPPASKDETHAREGFNILGLNLIEQTTLIDQHQGDWEAIARAVNREIDSRDNPQ